MPPNIAKAKKSEVDGLGSDLSDAQWALLEPLELDRHSGSGRHMQLELRAVVNTILYVLQSGCAWRYLPKDDPNDKTVYYYFRKWSWNGTWERVNTALREHVRQAAEHDAQPSVAILDSQSERTTEVGGEHGSDGHKQVNGRKRHILVDTTGNVLKGVAHAANIDE